MIDPKILDLIDGYLEGALGEGGVRELEQILRTDTEALAYYNRYAQLHIDLREEVRTAQATEKIMAQVDTSPRPGPIPVATSQWKKIFWGSAAAVAIATAAIAGRWSSPTEPKPMVAPTEEAIAWLTNAQDSRWVADRSPEATLRPGSVLELQSGLAEIRFRQGVKLVLQGPGELKLLSENAAELVRGRITAKVPEQAIGFELRSSQGKIIDLGTEFGVAINENGDTEVCVFEGKVDATPKGGQKVSLTKDQAITIADGHSKQVDLIRHQYTREIKPLGKIQPVTKKYDFRMAIPGTLADATGQGVGLTHRLPGTGADLGERDDNLALVPGRGLELTTTNSDINHQIKLGTGEYLGVRLQDLGFTGGEDFEVVADFQGVPALKRVGQFGLYAGKESDRNIRGGLISKATGEYTQFLTNNDLGFDLDSVFVGLYSTGDDIRVTLRRIKGKYSMSVENVSKQKSSTLVTRHASYLDDEKDIYVGMFGANTQSNDPKTLTIRNFEVTIWKPVP